MFKSQFLVFYTRYRLLIVIFSKQRVLLLLAYRDQCFYKRRLFEPKIRQKRFGNDEWPYVCCNDCVWWRFNKENSDMIDLIFQITTSLSIHLCYTVHTYTIHFNLVTNMMWYSSLELVWETPLFLFLVLVTNSLHKNYTEFPAPSKKMKIYRTLNLKNEYYMHKCE